jgi:NADH:ubiquinone reductase (H+-translocating)
MDVSALKPAFVSGSRVVIVGGGFGGLECAKALAAAPCSVTVIDRQNHHCFQPLLYQVATAALSPADVAWPIRSILSTQRNARVIMGEVTEIDRSRREVLMDGGTNYPFDYLVLATGVTHSYFGHDAWAVSAPGLKRIEDAVDIRRRILLAFERAEIEPDARERSRHLTFAIVGGGPTGVELAGAIVDLARFALSRDFRAIDPRAARIILLEAGPRLLPAFPDALSRYAERTLSRMGVEVRTSTAVTNLEKGRVVTAREIIPTGCVVWAAGVKASSAAQWLDADADRAGRLKVLPDLSVSGEPNIFAIGDTAAISGASGPVPGIAPAAKQMGRYVGRLIRARLCGQSHSDRFAYRHAGDLAAIGRKAAIVSIGRLRLTGFPAWMFWGLAHIYYLIGARNRLVVALDWLWDYVTFQRGARLINECGMRHAASPPAPKKQARDARSYLQPIED